MVQLHGNAESGSGALWQLPTPARRLLLIAPPLVLAGFTVLHPNPDHNTQALMDVSTWFMVFHMIQLALVGLVVIAVFVLADQYGRARDWPTCIGLGVFLVFFSAYDTLAGIGTGLAMRGARALPEAQQDAVFDLVKTWPAVDPWVFWLGLVGTAGWVLALVYLTVTMRALGVPRLQWICLGMAAFFMMLGHPAPFGTLAFGSLCVAALVHEQQVARVPRGQSPEAPRQALTEQQSSAP